LDSSLPQRGDHFQKTMLMVDVYLRRESGGGEFEKKKIDDNSRMKNKLKNLFAHVFRHQKLNILICRLFLKFPMKALQIEK